jgi:nitroimidazol reductase NimA-like FMN-containing flavoprotein (pyridoxamine 5'-phosphate oxidase superfamily)
VDQTISLTFAGKYDYDTVHKIIDTTPILHVSFPAPGGDPFPVVLPMLGCTGLFDAAAEEARAAERHYQAAPGSFPTGDQPPAVDFPTGPRHIYLHGHSAARLFQISKSEDGRLPVTLAAASMQGVVLALTPFHNSCNYASAVVQGYASPVADEAERLYALARITDSLVPGRWDNSRSPPTRAEMNSTAVIRVEVESASAKVRVGGPSDDRADLTNEEVVGQVWTGVIPCWTVYGEPRPSSYNRVRTVPGYLGSMIEEGNRRGQRQAEEAINQAGGK